MYTEPRIINPDQLNIRAYIITYIDGKRYRFYNGSTFGINCFPNKAKSHKDREKILKRLSFELKKLLDKGWNPEVQRLEDEKIPAAFAFTQLKASVEKEDISLLHIRDLTSIADKFIEFLQATRLDDAPINSITTEQVSNFLNRFKSSATNYMNRRRGLAALFSRLAEKKLIATNPVHSTARLREVPSINLLYKKEQFKVVIAHLKEQKRELYLCCLLMYGCFLRPHQEIRMLKRGNFNEDLTLISLGGYENKSRRNRTVYVPEYVREELIQQDIHRLKESVNIFSKTTEPHNPSYFNTAWSRIKEDLVETGVISKAHTLYSFRHTAAVNMYEKVKDVFKIQQAFAHSSLRVTLTYLRNLGLIVDSSLEDLPEFPVD